MLPSTTLPFEDDFDLETYEAEEVIRELKTLRSAGSDQRKLDKALVDRFGDILTHQKHYLNIDFGQRRDWQVLRAWKAITGREQSHIMQQYDIFPFSLYKANYFVISFKISKISTIL